MTGARANATAASPRRIGVIGARGQLGRCLVRQVEASGDLALAFALTRDDLDQSDLPALEAAMPRWLDGGPEERPDVVINAAAFTQVDRCESERELAYRTNALAPAEWARALAARDIRFVHVSTDYVFAGDDSATPYTEDHPTDPRTVYGASKRAGEIAVLGTTPEALVVRTSWVFGPGRNFVVAILGAGAQAARPARRPVRLRVVERPARLLRPRRRTSRRRCSCWRSRDAPDWRGGLLHLRGGGETTWFEFAREILDRAGYADVEIDPVTSEAFETAANARRGRCSTRAARRRSGSRCRRGAMHSIAILLRRIARGGPSGPPDGRVGVGVAGRPDRAALEVTR